MAKITAHSGCDHTEDNSLQFLQYAFASTADSIEVDVRKRDDGNLVLGHDDCSDVSLKDAFALLKQHCHTRMNCDLKQWDLEVDVYALAMLYGVEKQLIYSGNVDIEKCKNGKKGFEDVEVYFNIENLNLDREEALVKIHEARIGVVNMEYHQCDVQTCKLLKSLDLKASVWTVQEIEDLKRLLEVDVVENITTRNLKQALMLKERVC